MKHGSLSVGALLKNAQGLLVVDIGSADVTLTAAEAQNGAISAVSAAAPHTIFWPVGSKHPLCVHFLNNSGETITCKMVGDVGAGVDVLDGSKAILLLLDAYPGCLLFM